MILQSKHICNLTQQLWQTIGRVEEAMELFHFLFGTWNQCETLLQCVHILLLKDSYADEK